MPTQAATKRKPQRGAAKPQATATPKPRPPLEPGKQWFSKPEAAQYLTISEKSLRRIIEEGKLTLCRLTKQRVALSRDDLDAYAASCRED